jgi:HYR domain-containing protein
VCGNRGVNHCNLDAAGGVYVDPGGELYLYGTEHDNDGPLPGLFPCTGAACSVKFEEFRPVPHATCSTVSDAWVEIYDDNTFGDRSLMIDYPDRFLEDYRNYDRAEGFEDKGSSVRWCLPPGVTYRLWEDKESCGGDHLDLVGNGALQSIADLDDVGFGDDASCSEWQGGPFADAGPDRDVECASHTTTPATLDGRQSSDVSGAPLEFTWSAAGVAFDDPHASQATGAFPKGTTVVTLSVSNGVASATDTAQVAVVDTSDPTVQCPAPIAVECTSAGGVPSDDAQLAAFLQGALASDVCDAAPVVTHDLPAFLPLGPTVVTFTATDHDANGASCVSTVSVADQSAPEIAVTLSQTELLPPDHRLVPITAIVTVTDRCDPAATFELVSISSNEDDDGLGDGHTAGDIQAAAPGTADTAFLLRAERSALGEGRFYTIVYRATDGSGNAREVTSLVSVPR